MERRESEEERVRGKDREREREVCVRGGGCVCVCVCVCVCGGGGGGGIGYEVSWNESWTDLLTWGDDNSGAREFKSNQLNLQIHITTKLIATIHILVTSWQRQR